MNFLICLVGACIIIGAIAGYGQFLSWMQHVPQWVMMILVLFPIALVLAIGMYVERNAEIGDNTTKAIKEQANELVKD